MTLETTADETNAADAHNVTVEEREARLLDRLGYLIARHLRRAVDRTPARPPSTTSDDHVP